MLILKFISQLLFEFFKQYIEVNKENEFVCKSCGHLMKIKKYVAGVYDSGSILIPSMNISGNMELEELREYEKFNKSIKNISQIRVFPLLYREKLFLL